MEPTDIDLTNDTIGKPEPAPSDAEKLKGIVKDWFVTLPAEEQRGLFKSLVGEPEVKTPAPHFLDSRLPPRASFGNEKVRENFKHILKEGENLFSVLNEFLTSRN